MKTVIFHLDYVGRTDTHQAEVALPKARSYSHFLKILSEKAQFTLLCWMLTDLKAANYHPKYCKRLSETIKAALKKHDSSVITYELKELAEKGCIRSTHHSQGRIEYLAYLSEQAKKI